MAMKRLVFFIFITTACLFASAVFASDTVAIATRDRLLPDVDEFSVSGHVPHVSFYTVNYSNLSEIIQLQNDINASIGEILEKRIEDGINNRARSLSFSYIHVVSELYESVVVFSDMQLPGYAKREAASFTVDKNTLTVVGINDIFGSNGVKLFNAYLNALVWSDPDKYNPTFTGVSDNTAFYATDEGVHLIFNSYEITKGGSDVEVISLPFDLIKNLVIEYIDSGFSIILPLRDVCEFFGFEIIWQGFFAPIGIVRGDFSTYITLYENSYTSGALNIALEAPPAYINGATHVPLTFFEEILGLTYTVGEDFHITISELT